MGREDILDQHCAVPLHHRPAHLIHATHQNHPQNVTIVGACELGEWQPRNHNSGDLSADVVGAVLARAQRAGVRWALIGERRFTAKRAHGTSSHRDILGLFQHRFGIERGRLVMVDACYRQPYQFAWKSELWWSQEHDRVHCACQGAFFVLLFYSYFAPNFVTLCKARTRRRPSERFSRSRRRELVAVLLLGLLDLLMKSLLLLRKLRIILELLQVSVVVWNERP